MKINYSNSLIINFAIAYFDSTIKRNEIMTTYTTITGRKIRVGSNYSKRTFTIKTDSSTFRTFKMTKEEFNENLYNTANDWNQFLKSDDYYKVK